MDAAATHAIDAATTRAFFLSFTRTPPGPPYRQTCLECRSDTQSLPGEGVEPSRGCPRRFLRPLRLPFRHPGQVDSVLALVGNRNANLRVPSNAWTTRRSSSGHAAETAMPLQQLSLATRMSSTRWPSGFSGHP